MLITGCSSGIGAATARAFGASGATVYATARNPESLAELTAGGAHALALDVLDETSMQTAVETVESREGAVDVLINNAGYALQSPVEEADLDDVRLQFETNVFGLVRLTQLVLPAMRRQHAGRIINLSSMAGRFTLPGGGFYHATKHAVESLSDALRLEVAPFGIFVSLIEPGPVRTEFGATAIGTIDAAQSTPDGPYGGFKRRLATAYADAYDGRSRFLVSSADDVADVIVRAAGSSHPAARYPVGPVARAVITGRRVLPDRVFDALVKAAFPTP